METKSTTRASDFDTTTPTAGARSSQDSPVTEKVRTSAHDAIDRASETVASAEQSLRETAQASEQRIRQAGSQAQEVSEQAYSTVRSYMREHPLESLGIAFVSGVVLSSILRR